MAAQQRSDGAVTGEALLRPVTESDLALILKWRNHPEVRKVMFTDHEIPPAEHLAWWDKVKTDPTRKAYVFVFRDEPVGVINFFDLHPVEQRCSWGFFLDLSREWGPGEKLQAWLQAEQVAIRQAFGPLGCEKLYCETFDFNEQVLALHKKVGFKEVEVLEREKDGHSHKVIVMAMEKEAWMVADQKRRPVSVEARLHVAFFGSANWDLIAQDFTREYQALTGDAAQVAPIPFGQYRILLTDPSSSLRKGDLDFSFFCERFEDLLGRPYSIFDLKDRSVVESRFNDYLEVIRTARDHLKGRFLVLDLAPVRALGDTLDSACYEPESEAGFVNDLNARLSAFCASLPDCHVVRLSSVVGAQGSKTANPAKYWHLGRIAFPAPFGRALNHRLIQTILALDGKTARVLVVDLDNTLWGGVIGDDGLQGIRLGGDYPGSVFVEIQETLKVFRNRGVALAICSKNTPEIALEAIKTLPDMKLRLDDFVATRINWQDKANNIREIADEIGVGLASICVIDDSPYERNAIRRALPEVQVPEMPDDLTQWSSFLLNHPYLGSLRLTKEDRERVERYHLRARIRKESSELTSKEDYWRSLGMHLQFHGFVEATQQRTLQLLNKTNQFNMTTHRYTQADLDRIQREGGRIVPVGLSDKYSEAEIIGVIIFIPSRERPATLVIDSFLLSCRVLGRSVETGIIGWLCRYAKQRGYHFLEGLFYPTERNLPASTVYQDHNFADDGHGRWILDLEQSGVEFPEWFSITDEVER